MHFAKERKVLWFWLVMLVAVCLESLIPHASLPGPKFPISSVVRVVVFFLLAFLPMLDFPRLRHAIYVALSMALVGLLLEYLQRSIPGRHFSTVDMIANNVGVLLGFIVGFIVRMRRETKRTSRSVPVDRD